MLTEKLHRHRFFRVRVCFVNGGRRIGKKGGEGGRSESPRENRGTRWAVSRGRHVRVTLDASATRRERERERERGDP